MPQHDRYDDDCPPRPRRRAPAETAIQAAVLAVWSAAALATVVIAVLWVGAMRRAQIVFDEVNASAMAAAGLVGVYVAARAVDRILHTAIAMRG